METFARLFGPFRRAPLATKQPPEPELFAQPRPMTSFLDSLTTEQKEKLRAYRGAENHGDPAFHKPPSA